MHSGHSYGGKKHEKVVLYKRAKHEMFPKHAHAEGLTSRVTIYDDDECVHNNNAELRQQQQQQQQQQPFETTTRLLAHQA